jgi:tyrosyl-tRNA synthetase
MPTATVSDDDFKDGAVDLITLLVVGGLCPTRSEARRNIEQGGVTVNGEKETDFRKTYTKDDFGDGIVLKRGKKNFKKLVL